MLPHSPPRDITLARVAGPSRPMSTAAVPTPAPAPPPPAADAPKPKKICCACPETRKPRDECVVTHGEDKCAAQIEAHKKCLRAEGFDVRAPPCHASHAPYCRLTVPPLARQV